MRNNFKRRLDAVAESMTAPLAVIARQRLAGLRLVMADTDAGREAVEHLYSAARVRHHDTPEARTVATESTALAEDNLIVGAKLLFLADLSDWLEGCRASSCEGATNAAK